MTRKTKRMFLVAVFMSLTTLGVAFAQCPGGTWVGDLAPMLGPRQEIAAAELNGKIYVIGGFDVGGVNTDLNDVYDTEKDSWTRVANFPRRTDHAWAVSLNGKVYAGGGGSNRVFTYDPNQDGWTEIEPTSVQHGGTPVAAVLDGLIYLAGGTGGTQRELEVYDPEKGTWTPLAPMSCARNHTAGGIINGKLYVAGGRPGSQTCLEEYDPVKDTWTMKAPMPTGRSGIGGGVVGDCLYVFGGEGNVDDPNGIFHEVEAYDPTTDTWNTLDPMRTGRHGIYAAVIGNMIYFPGGATRQGFGATDTNDVFIVGAR